MSNQMRHKRIFIFLILILLTVLIILSAVAYADQIYKGEGTEGGLVPDFTQTFTNKNGGICCAAAMANSLWYWDQHGYKDLVKQKDESKPNANWKEDGEKLTLELAELIYGGEYLKKPEATKSNGLGQEAGIQKYIDSHKTMGEEPLVIQYLSGNKAIYDNWEAELKACEDVVARVIWRDAQGNELPAKKGGGSHALTGVGYDTEKKKFKVAHGWGNHYGEEKPYPDIPDTKNYYQEYNMEIIKDGNEKGMVKIPKVQNENADLFWGAGGNADHVFVQGFYRISPGKKTNIKGSRLPTPDPKKDQYRYSVKNLDFDPIYQFALEIQVPFFSVKAPEGWSWVHWDPRSTKDVTPAPFFRKLPWEEPVDVIWEPEWRGILWYTTTRPILGGYELDGFSFEVDRHVGHSENVSLSGLSDGVTSYIRPESIGLITEFQTVSGPMLIISITGYNTNWLIITAISLLYAGVYLIFRQKRKAAFIRIQDKR